MNKYTQQIHYVLDPQLNYNNFTALKLCFSYTFSLPQLLPRNAGILYVFLLALYFWFFQNTFRIIQCTTFGYWLPSLGKISPCLLVTWQVSAFYCWMNFIVIFTSLLIHVLQKDILIGNMNKVVINIHVQFCVNIIPIHLSKYKELLDHTRLCLPFKSGCAILHSY